MKIVLRNIFSLNFSHPLGLLKMMARIYLVAFYMLFVSFQASAYWPEEGNINAIVGLIHTKTNFENSNSSVPSTLLGGLGLYSSGDVNETSALDIGLVFSPK